MSYKVDSEKALKLLRCISPPIIFCNGMFGVGKTEFVKKFKREGFSVLSLQDFDSNDYVSSIQAYLKNRRTKSFDHNPVIIEGTITNEKLLSEIFSGEFHNFTYVYVYPNNSKLYKENLKKLVDGNKAPDLEKSSNIYKLLDEIKNYSSKKNTGKENRDDNKGQEVDHLDLLFTKLTLELINTNKEVYKKHLEEFDEKILTVLI